MSQESVDTKELSKSIPQIQALFLARDVKTQIEPNHMEEERVSLEEIYI